MNDLISRQAAIDAIDEYDFEFPNYMERFVTELRDAMKADLKNDIDALPPAQPEIMREGEPMNDLISRQAAIDASCTCHGGVHCNHYPCKDVQAIMDLPAAQPVDVAPERHGYWKQATPFVDTIECSECGYQWPEPDFASNYCPDCGAKMDGGE